MNSALQRTRITHADGSFCIYQYDILGQVITGNRQTAAHGGNADGYHRRVEFYIRRGFGGAPD